TEVIKKAKEAGILLAWELNHARQRLGLTTSFTELLQATSESRLSGSGFEDAIGLLALAEEQVFNIESVRLQQEPASVVEAKRLEPLLPVVQSYRYALDSIDALRDQAKSRGIAISAGALPPAILQAADQVDKGVRWLVQDWQSLAAELSK